MPHTVLVVEYEPRYLDRMRQAFKGRPLTPLFARDGQEALATFESARPAAIVLSWILPKASAAELIRTLRELPGGRETKILITVSGYSGADPHADARRVGADDLLAKPFADAELLSRIASLLEIDQAAMTRFETELGDFSIEPPPQKHPAGAHAVAQSGEKLTSSDIFGEVLGDDTSPPSRPVPPAPPAAATPEPAPEPPAEAAPSRDLDAEIDHLLNQTFVSLKKKKQAPESAVRQIDRLVEDTLSGIHRGRKRDAVPDMAPADAAAAAPDGSAPPDAPVEISRDASTDAVNAAPPRAELEPSVAEPEPFETSEPEPSAPPAHEPRPPKTPDEFERVHAASPIVEPLGDATATARPGATFGQFVLREKIATGGMAEIWKAQMHGVEGFEKLVAIKRILPHLSADQEFVAMFVDEAKIAARLNHPNITHIYDLGRAAGSHYIAMELVDGHDLKSALRRAAACDRPMGIELAVFIASRLAAALDYAHRKEEGLVHRDVSPQNVLISWDGDIKLCDFGIAKATSRVSHTQTGALKGKLQYMSPEQASGKAIDRRSDIFSLGAVLFEMLTRRKLFTGENEASVLDQVREADVQPPSVLNDEVPAELDRIVLRALAKDPEERYPSAGEMARDLDQILYAFRPAPAAADLAVWMHHLWSTEPLPAPVVEPPKPEPPAPAPLPPPERVKVAPRVQPEELAPAAPRAAAVDDLPSRPVLSAAEPRGSKKGLVVAALLALAALGGTAGWFLLKAPQGGAAVPSEATTSAAMISQKPAPAPPAAIVPAGPGSLELPAAQPDTAAVAPPAPDLVGEEVQRRLDLERRRLEEQRRRQAEGAKAAPAPGRTEPAQREPEPPRAAEPQPPPAPATETVAPPPVETATTAPATPPPADPAPARVERGDYVAPGTPGLVDPVLVSLRKVSYPAIARARRIEGIVIVQALVSETGAVVEAKILRGVKGDAGIDAAALDAVRGASFKPATKDGVAVRTLKTVTVPFKL